MKKITVSFKTITPLYTGDAWGECKEIKPSAIMGSLRNYFNIYCKENKIPLCKIDKKGKINEELKYDKFKKDLFKLKDIKKALTSQNISLESQIFGCTGWKSRVLIERINFDKKNLKSIVFVINENYFDDFKKFLDYLKNKNKEIYIGKGHKKKKGGKVKIISIKNHSTKLDISKLQEKWKNR